MIGDVPPIKRFELARQQPRARITSAWTTRLAILPMTKPCQHQLVRERTGSVEDTLGQTPEDRLASQFSTGKVLLILDNCEHVRGGCEARAEELIARCDNLAIVTTSREPLGVSNESVWQVPPLSLPTVGNGSPPESLTAYDSVSLFIERAIDARPNFQITNETAPVVAEICSRLDGIPLAIELAAARIRVMSVQRILEGLSDRFRLLVDRSELVPARQSTLLASVEWSYDLMSDKERLLLERLAVFAGSFEIDAAEKVCAAEHLEVLEILDLLGRLVERSLVTYDHLQGSRYKLLETIREFAAYKLDLSGESHRFRERHLAYFTTFAEELDPILQRRLDATLLDRFESERYNFRAALEWAVAHDKAIESLRLAVALITFWRIRGYYWEGESALKRAFDAEPSPPAELKAKALWGLGHMRLTGMDAATAFGLGDILEALAIAQSSGDVQTTVRTMAQLGATELLLMPETPSEHLEEAVAMAREAGDEGGLIFCLFGSAYVRTYFQNRHEDAAEAIAELRKMNEALESPWVTAFCDAMTGEAYLRLGRSARGRLEGVELCRISALLADGDFEGARSVAKPVQQAIRNFGLPHYFLARVA